MRCYVQPRDQMDARWRTSSGVTRLENGLHCECRRRLRSLDGVTVRGEEEVFQRLAAASSLDCECACAYPRVLAVRPKQNSPFFLRGVERRHGHERESGRPEVGRHDLGVRSIV
jgi:hypothetical protein